MSGKPLTPEERDCWCISTSHICRCLAEDINAAIRAAHASGLREGAEIAAALAAEGAAHGYEDPRWRDGFDRGVRAAGTILESDLNRRAEEVERGE
jgi:hypothetical protein